MKYLLPLFLMTFLVGAAEPQDAPKLKVGDAMPALKGDWINTNGFETKNKLKRVVIVEFFAPVAGNDRKGAAETNEKLKANATYLAITQATLGEFNNTIKHATFPKYAVGFSKKMFDDFGATAGTSFIFVDKKLVWTGPSEQASAIGAGLIADIKFPAEKQSETEKK